MLKKPTKQVGRDGTESPGPRLHRESECRNAEQSLLLISVYVLEEHIYLLSVLVWSCMKITFSSWCNCDLSELQTHKSTGGYIEKGCFQKPSEYTLNKWTWWEFKIPFDTVLHSSAGQAKSLHAEEQENQTFRYKCRKEMTKAVSMDFNLRTLLTMYSFS